MDAKIAEAIIALKEAESSGDKRRAKERKEDLMRLKRVEQIYVRISVAVALKILTFFNRAQCFLFYLDGF